MIRMETIRSNKDLNIETLRGLAIFFMVFGHIIGYTAQDGLKVPDDSGWRYSYYILQYIRMPLFTVISGFVYAYKPLSRFSSVPKFLERKVNRLLVPLIVVSTLFFLLQYFTPGTNGKTKLGEIWTIYLFPFAHFWFLQGMIITFLLVTALEKLKLLDNLKTALLCLFIAAMVFFSGLVDLRFFSFQHVPFLLTFFLLGLILKRFFDLIFTKTNMLVVGLVFLGSMSYQLYVYDGPKMPMFLDHGLTLLVGSSACMLLINLGLQNQRLIWLGNFSYGIYLFHVFGTAAARIFLLKLHVTNNLVHVFVGLLIGLGAPIILQLMVPKRSLLALMFFGDKIGPAKSKQVLPGESVAS